MAGENAQFVIDISAKLDGGEGTIAELDALSSKLLGLGKGADAFEDAAARVSRGLDEARAASVAANKALDEGTDLYRALEKAANDSSKAAEKAALKNKGVVPDDLAANAMSAAMALGRQAEKVRDLEKAAKAAGETEDKFAKRLAGVKDIGAHVDKTIQENEKHLNKLHGAFGAIGGPIGAIGQRFTGFKKKAAELTETLGSSRAGMLLAGAAAMTASVAVAAVGVAAAAAVVGVAAWAAGLADAARTAALTHDALRVLHPAIAAVEGDYADLTKETGLSTAELDKIANSLEDAKVKADDMPGALRAAALAEAGLGQGGAQEFISGMQASRKSVREFAAETSSGLEGIVAKKMRGLGAQGERLQRNLAGVFGGLNIDPLLNGLERVVALFDETTVSGKAIKFLFESIFQPIIDGADAAGTAIEAFALGFEIGLVKLYIALKPTIKQAKELFGIDDSSTFDGFQTLTSAGEVLAGVFAIASKPAIDFINILHAMGEAAFAIDDAFENVMAKLRALDFGEIGRAMMQGLVDGIKAGGTAVVDAVLAPVHGAVNAAKKALGIASPSKVFAAIGENTALGFAGGVDRAAPDAQSAVTDMLAAPMPAPQAITVSAPASAPASLSGAVFNFYGVKDAEHAAELVSEAITRILEGDAATIAGAMPATAGA